MKQYIRSKCPVCGKDVSTAGLPHISHMRKHVREGLLQEKQEDISYFDSKRQLHVKHKIRFEKV